MQKVMQVMIRTLLPISILVLEPTALVCTCLLCISFLPSTRYFHSYFAVLDSGFFCRNFLGLCLRTNFGSIIGFVVCLLFNIMSDLLFRAPFNVRCLCDRPFLADVNAIVRALANYYGRRWRCHGFIHGSWYNV